MGFQKPFKERYNKYREWGHKKFECPNDQKNITDGAQAEQKYRYYRLKENKDAKCWKIKKIHIRDQQIGLYSNNLKNQK